MNVAPSYALASEFIEQLQYIPWFENLGKSSVWDESVQRIHSWGEVPVPEYPLMEAFAVQTQIWKDSLFATHKSKRDELLLDTAWQETHQLVMRLTAAKVPFDPDQDAWHAPSLSVWSAAWIASVISCYLMYRQMLPDELQRVWTWYTRGHWPCCYAEVPKDAHPGILLIY